MDYNLLRIFAKVSELGSFTRAAEVLNQPKSRVSRAISRFEQELGVSLLHRTTRKTTLTSSGQDFYQSITPLLNSIDQELVKVSNSQRELSGVIRITAPQDLAQSLVSQVINQYSLKYPKVEVQTLITNDLLNLSEKNIDISFRAGQLNDSRLIQKKIMTMNFIAVCSPGYLNQREKPKQLKDLSQHNFLSFKNIERKFFPKSVKFEPTFTSDSTLMLLSMVLKGAGIAVLPDYFCKEKIESKELVVLFPEWKTTKSDIHLLYHSGQRSSEKIKKFIQTTEQCL